MDLHATHLPPRASASRANFPIHQMIQAPIGRVSYARIAGCRTGGPLGTEERETFKDFIGKFIEVEVVELAPESWSVVAAVSEPVTKVKCPFELADERPTFSEVRSSSIEDVLVQPDVFRVFFEKVTKAACDIREANASSHHQLPAKRGTENLASSRYTEPWAAT